MNDDKITKYNIKDLLDLGARISLIGVKTSIQQKITEQLKEEPVIKLQKLLLSTTNKYLKEAIHHAITLRLTEKDELLELNTFSVLIRDFEFEFLQALSKESKNLFVKDLAKELIDEIYFIIESNNSDLQYELAIKQIMKD